MNLTRLAGVFLIPLTACTAMPPLDESLREFRQRQQTAAEIAEQQGRQANALSLWRSLELLGGDPEINQRVADLETRIKSKVEHALAKGKAAYARGDTAGGDLWMLKALALQPVNQQAKRQLAQSTSHQAGARQQEKVDRESQPAVAAGRDVAEGANHRLRQLYDSGQYRTMVDTGIDQTTAQGDEARALLRSAHLRLAETAERSGDRETALSHIQSALVVHPIPDDPLLERVAVLRGALSEQWYIEGTRVMKTDLPAAIAALETSLDYNPYNEAAKSKLAQAQTLQRNLERIQNPR